MAVESLPLPLLASVKAVPALQPRMSADRYRAAIAIAAASVFISGVGSVYVSMQAQALDAKPAPAADAPVAVPADAVVVAAPARDMGPTRRWGPGSAVDIEEATLGVKRLPMYETGHQASPLSTSIPSNSRTSTSASRATTSSTSSSASSASSSSAATGSAYTVREGDDFGSIAARLGISSTRIASLNPGVDSTKLSIGQSLNVG